MNKRLERAQGAKERANGQLAKWARLAVLRWARLRVENAFCRTVSHVFHFNSHLFFGGVQTNSGCSSNAALARFP